MARTVLVVLAILPLWGTEAGAQSGPVAAGLDATPAWTLGTAKARPAHPRKPAGAPAITPEAADRAARLAEARRRFFANRPDDEKPHGVPQFGGYDAAKDSGTLRPSAMFKF